MSTITPDSVWAVILAAGTSSRLGQPKQLLDLGGEPILNHVLRAAAMSQLGGAVLVVGHQAVEIASAVGDFGQITVVNQDYAEGQSTSLRVGIDALPASATAAVVLLGDQPLVTPALIDRLVGTFVERGEPDRFMQTRYSGTAAPPVLIGSAWFPRLHAITGDQGAREMIREHGEKVDFVESGQDRPLDIDTMDDYRELLSRSGKSGAREQRTWPGAPTQ